MPTGEFGPCEICGGTDWSSVYQGPVRDGKFGKNREHATVAQCGVCAVQRLEEAQCLPEVTYEDWEYRRRLDQPQNLEDHVQQHDQFQRRVIDYVLACGPRGKIIADIGCGGGVFLDHIRGLAARAIGVEPNREFSAALEARGIDVFSYARDVDSSFEGAIDLAVSFQVIEHTTNPRLFLEEIRPFLKSEGGTLLLTTPNRRDILMDLLPVDFRRFFYRIVHRWYFDMESLTQCALRAGYSIKSMSCIHGYGLSNAVGWLRDRKPIGWIVEPGINPTMDAMWKLTLEESGRGDVLLAALVPL